MRHPDLTNSCSLASRAIFSLSLIGSVLCAGTATCVAQKPDSSQVEFDSSAEMPMDIMKGTKPATMADTQFAGTETETFVTISPDSNGRKANTPNEPVIPVARQPVLIVASLPTSDVVAGEPSAVNAKKSAPLSSRTLSQIDQLTIRLVSQSRDAWLRGLMDQASYAAWLDVASTTQLRIATHQGDQNRALLVLRDQVALWTEAANELEEFDQPAARGWEADLSHSRVMALRAKLRYSVAAGRQLTVYDQQAYTQLAAEHLNLRLQEFQTGTGTATSVLNAARMVDEQIVVSQPANNGGNQTGRIPLASFQVARPVAIRAALTEIQRPVHLETYPYAIAVRDLAEDRAALRRAVNFSDFAGTPADVRKSDTFMTSLERHAEEIAVRQFARLQTGTATPGGMLREWWLQESLADGLQENISDTAFYTGQTQRLQAIHQAALSLQDLRGRNVADVAAAEMLVAVRQLDLQPLHGRKSSAPYDETPSSSEALVIDYEPNNAATEPVKE